MIKYRLLILIVCLYMFCIVGIEKINAQGYDDLMLRCDSVIQVDINAEGPSYLEHQKYNYSTVLRNEIKYILNYINNFHLEDDGVILNANDTSSYSMKIYMIDGSIKKCGFYAGRFYDEFDKQYAINNNEYNCFLNFICALKTKQLILNDEVTFEASEWARDDVDTAVEWGLVPKQNQINYKGKVHRLEVCQLIDHLLNKKNVIKSETTENPFSDTTDKSVISLYNHGIVSGKNESEFVPYGFITREELSKVLSNTYYLINRNLQFDNCTHEYADQKEISCWALKYVNDMYSLKIMIGNQENEFKPHDNVTKEELIIALLRIYA